MLIYNWFLWHCWHPIFLFFCKFCDSDSAIRCPNLVSRKVKFIEPFVPCNQIFDQSGSNVNNTSHNTRASLALLPGIKNMNSSWFTLVVHNQHATVKLIICFIWWVWVNCFLNYIFGNFGWINSSNLALDQSNMRPFWRCPTDSLNPTQTDASVCNRRSFGVANRTDAVELVFFRPVFEANRLIKHSEGGSQDFCYVWDEQRIKLIPVAILVIYQGSWVCVLWNPLHFLRRHGHSDNLRSVQPYIIMLNFSQHCHSGPPSSHRRGRSRNCRGSCRFLLRVWSHQIVKYRRLLVVNF